MKRKLKKSVYFLFVLLIVIILMLMLILKLTKKDNKKEDKTNSAVVEEKVEQKEETKNKMSLIAVGDVLIHESVYKDAYNNGTYDFSKMFTLVKPIISKYDLKFCNQESIIGGSVLGISGYPSFNSPDEIGDELVNMGFNMISLANNHSMDKGEDAILYSNSYWKSKDVITAGSYSSNEERERENVYEKNGIKYAFFAYTTSLNGKRLNKSYLVNMYDPDIVKNDIDKIKDKVDVIIVSMHWGEEYTNVPTASEIEIAQYLSSLGANLIIGTHPHVVQPIDYIGDTLVIYSLGNFISNQLSIGLNPGIGLMVGMDIVVNEGKVTFENIYKELILAYAENSTHFSVIPFTKLNDDLLSDYKLVEEKYMKIVNNEE